jgi:hypothetical protein
MSTCLSHRPGIVARKLHQCAFCCTRIEVGSKYDRTCGVSEGDFWTTHAHPECTEKFDSLPHFEKEEWCDGGQWEPLFDRPQNGGPR